jgi:4-aminobutyrate aminotransferase-like enzyme
VLQVMEAEDVPARARRAGARLTDEIQKLYRVHAVRGLGLLIAVELDLEPDGPKAGDVADRALAEGLVVNAVTPTALRLAPSLLVTDAEIDEAVGILRNVLATIR